MEYLVIKCGGSIHECLPDSFYRNLIQLAEGGEVFPVLIHGGGPLITSLLNKLGIETQFMDGLRVTTEEVLDVVEMALSGIINKQIVRKIHSLGGRVIGLSGSDGGLIEAKPVSSTNKLGYVGEVESVNYRLIQEIAGIGYIPVISPVGADQSGQRYNINADVAAAAFAKALKARICFVTDVDGIYVQSRGNRVTLKKAGKNEIERMIRDGTITGGMVPKVKSALDALACGIPEAAIINGMLEDSLLSFCEGREIGTKIVMEELMENV